MGRRIRTTNRRAVARNQFKGSRRKSRQLIVTLAKVAESTERAAELSALMASKVRDLQVAAVAAVLPVWLAQEAAA